MSGTVLEQVNTLIMQPGAKPNCVLLGVDLSEVKEASQVLAVLVEQGYQPEIRYLQLKIGLHVFAVLKDEPYVSDGQYESLQDEWEELCSQISPIAPNKVVRLWRGLPTNAAQ
ncbi:MAG: hypothetical protein NW224_15290 [Leptolyngbyaceae cyanobacterium bins.302]|nr:hypothetical protein [Leptolyngbyaceae cyanobacterium bins.302]